MSYSSARRAREHGKRAVVTVDVAGADGTPVPHTIPRALFSASLQERAAKRSRADKALRAARAAPPRPPAVDNNTIVVVAPRNPQRRERRKRKPKKKAPAPAATNAVDRKADGWWRSLEGIDPISLEPLKLLPIPPFTLRSANLTGASHSHFFDAQVLASYFTRTADFTNPITREPLSGADCTRLDKHLARHKLPKVDVADAYLLSQHILAQSGVTAARAGGHGGEVELEQNEEAGQRQRGAAAAAHRPERATHAQVRDATVMMHSLFDFTAQPAAAAVSRSDRGGQGARSGGGRRQQQGGGLVPSQTAAIRTPSTLSGATRSNRRYNRQRRAVHAEGGVTVYDDDDWVSDDAGGESAEEENPRLPGTPAVPWGGGSGGAAAGLNATSRAFHPTKMGFAALLKPSGVQSKGAEAAAAAAAAMPTSWAKAKSKRKKAAPYRGESMSMDSNANAGARPPIAAAGGRWSILATNATGTDAGDGDIGSKSESAGTAPRLMLRGGKKKSGGGSSWRDRAGISASDAPRRPRLALRSGPRDSGGGSRSATSHSGGSSIFGSGRSRADVLASKGVDVAAVDLAVEAKVSRSGASSSQTRLCPFLPSLLVVALDKRAWVAGLEGKLAKVVQGSTSSSAGVTLALEPMRREQRKFVHALCECYGLVGKAQDDEPNRFIVVTRGPHSIVPSLRLSTAVAMFAPILAQAGKGKHAGGGGGAAAGGGALLPQVWSESMDSMSDLQLALSALVEREELERRKTAYHLHLWAVRGSSPTANETELLRELRGAFEVVVRRSEFDLTLVGVSTLGHALVEFSSRATARRVLHKLLYSGNRGEETATAETVWLGSCSFKCEWWAGGNGWLRRQLALIHGAQSENSAARDAEHAARRAKRRQERAARAALTVAEERDAKLKWCQADEITRSAFALLASSESSSDEGGEKAPEGVVAPQPHALEDAVVQLRRDQEKEATGEFSIAEGQLNDMGFTKNVREGLRMNGGDVRATIEHLMACAAASEMMNVDDAEVATEGGGGGGGGWSTAEAP